MTRTSLDDSQWVSLMLVMQQILSSESAMRWHRAVSSKRRSGSLDRRAVARPARRARSLVERPSPLAALVPVRLVEADLRATPPKPAS
jgi:hypothetical protein